jgi:hypothetical protein
MGYAMRLFESSYLGARQVSRIYKNVPLKIWFVVVVSTTFCASDGACHAANLGFVVDNRPALKGFGFALIGTLKPENCMPPAWCQESPCGLD